MTKNKKKLWADKLEAFNLLMCALKKYQEKFLKDARKAKCKFDHPEDIPLMVTGITKKN